MPTSSSDDSIGVQLDLGLEIVQDIIGLPYHGLGTNFGASCKCVWIIILEDDALEGSCHKIQSCFTGHPLESWCKGPHPSSHQSCKHFQPPPTAYSPKPSKILLQTSGFLPQVYLSNPLLSFSTPISCHLKPSDWFWLHLTRQFSSSPPKSSAGAL